jgi:hypothetical protein
VKEPPPEEQTARFSGRGAFAISQAYSYIAAAIGMAFLIGGLIAGLIALRKLVLPSPPEAFASEFLGPSESGSDEAVRSLLGALSYAIPGALVFVWHTREARRRAERSVPATHWGAPLYFHLVALITLVIAMGGAAALSHSLVDAALPDCVETPSIGAASFDPQGSPIPQITLSPDSPLVDPDRRCSPPASVALRSAMDAGIVTMVAGLAWLWHLGRARRALDPSAEVTVED